MLKKDDRTEQMVYYQVRSILSFFYTRMYPGLIITNVRSLAWDRDVPLEHSEPEGDQGADRQAARRGHCLGLERPRHGYVFDVAQG